MAERHQEQIRERAIERAAEGENANPSLEDLLDAARGEPLQKRRKHRERLVEPPGSGTPRTTNVRTGLRKAGGRDGGSASPVAQMLGDMGRVLEEFRKAEGRDPTSEDGEFWTAYKKVIKNRLDA